MNNKNIKNFALFILVILICLLILISQACSKIDFEFFGFKFGGETGDLPAENDTSEEEKNNEDSGKEGGNDDEDIEDPPDKNSPTDTGELNTSTGTADNSDIDEMRSYFTEAMGFYKDGSYFVAEYYLNKIKDNYIILQDHIFYYMAKSLLMQEKYGKAGEYYLKLINNYPDSVWAEQAYIEYADLFYIKENYFTAEKNYENFRTDFPDSSYMPYCLYRMALCQEKSDKKIDAYNNYKEIWLNFPLSEYSKIAMENLNRLSDEGTAEKFVPTADQLYKRGDIFFNSYNYQNALDEYNVILTEDYLNNLSLLLHGKTLFKVGMCYFRLRDYSRSIEYLTLAYDKNTSGIFADDSLYYTGGALANLDRDNEAISYYNKLVNLFSSSNFSDDALYRIGRIYSLNNDYINAAAYFKRIPSEYPGGDKLADALWELGLIQYRSGDYSSAKATFSSCSSSYKGTSLKEKGLFWQAKCCRKMGEDDTAAGLYREIIDLCSYSYYTFASHDMLEQMGISADIKKINKGLNPENYGYSITIPENSDAQEEDAGLTADSAMDEDSGAGHINKAIELLTLEFFNSASLEINAASSELEENPERTVEIAVLFLESGNYSSSINLIGKNLKRLKSELDDYYIDYIYYLYYPYGFKEIVEEYSSRYDLDPLFTLAVIRQESNFMPDAVSYAGARGLMQIMPLTGEGIASQIGIPDFAIGMLIEPEINIRMGTFYLRQQLDNFSQNRFYCLGAYNGGPGRMSGWVSDRGSKDIDEFIESISYEQSRDYIKRVMGHYYFYQMLYSE
ncbi:MAG: tetratricopeptide repeat protein [Actinomycetota bacterium]|nr:tetratricopeptide repeat protein [Actinomycetota bacterium]